MSSKFIVASTLAIAAVTGALIGVGLSPAAANEGPRFAMHDMMPMQSGSGGSMSGGMMDNMMSMQPGGMQMQGQSGQAGPQSQGSMGQGGSSGQMGGMQGQSGSTGGGMRMNDNMPMQQGQPGQMTSGMQAQGSTGQAGSMGQGAMSGQAGGMMSGEMMRMMNDHMRMMNDQMRMRGGMPGMAAGPSMVDMTDRIEGRIAFLRAELRITDTQASAWNTFADALRSSRTHLIEARQQLSQPYTKPADRLEQYERHLSARLEALKLARTSLAQVYNSLDEAQKRTADELVAPFLATF